MSMGRQRVLWEHTCTLQAQIINLLAPDPISADELNPLKPQRRVNKGHPLTCDTLEQVRLMLIRRNANR
jgi:hypothetical protein